MAKSAFVVEFMDRETLKSKALRGVLWISCTRVLSQVISWLSFILVIRILSPGDFGLMAMAVILVGFIKLFNEMGLGAAIIQKQTLDKRDLSTVFWFNLILSCILYIFLFLLAPLAAAFFNDERIIGLIRVIGLILFLGSLKMIPFNMLIKDMNFNKKSKAELIAQVFSGPTTLLFAISGFGVWSLVMGVVVKSAVLTAVVTYYYPWAPAYVFQPRRIRELLRFGLQILGSRALWYSYKSTDILIIAKILGESLLGFYKIALDLSEKGIGLLSSILSQVSFPLYSKLQNDRQSLQNYFLKLSRLVGLACFPAFAGLILVADDLFTIILTEKWRPAVPIFQIFCGVAMIRGLAVLIPPLLNATGRADLNLRYTFACGLIMPPAFLAGSFFGVTGVAYAWLFIYPFLFYYALTFAFQIINISLLEYVRNILPAISATFMMAVVIILFQSMIPPNLVFARFGGSCTIGVIIYLMLIHLFCRGLQEFSFILPVLKGQQYKGFRH